jgi:hypothetical protein
MSQLNATLKKKVSIALPGVGLCMLAEMIPAHVGVVKSIGFVADCSRSPAPRTEIRLTSSMSQLNATLKKKVSIALPGVGLCMLAEMIPAHVGVVKSIGFVADCYRRLALWPEIRLTSNARQLNTALRKNVSAALFGKGSIGRFWA